MIAFDHLKKNDPHLRMLGMAVLVGLLILLAGLWWVQIISHHRHTDSERNQSYRTVRIPAIRGKIFDRNGGVLAENRPSYDINLYLNELRPQFEEEFMRIRPRRAVTNPPPVWKRWLGIETPKVELVRLSRQQRDQLTAQAQYNVARRVVDEVGQVLGEEIPLTPEEFRRHYLQLRALPMPVRKNIDATQLARFLENTHLPQGVDLDVEPLRHYPQGRTAAHLVGHLVKDTRSQPGEVASVDYRMTDFRGNLGLEYVFDADLRGRAGVKSVLVNSAGYRISQNVWVADEPGRNVVLTIDLPLQRAAEEALASVGPDVRGAVVVMDARSGDLYALVSAPAYDPNAFVPGISSAEMAELNDPVMKPMRNRATQENYRPGSVFKIVTALACLQSGILNETNLHEPLPNPGFIMVGRRRIDDEAAAGEYTFERAFIKSSNTYFIHYGILAGFKAMQRAGMEFQFGQAMSLPTRQNTSGTFPDPAWIRSQRESAGLYWADGDTANLSMGQGFIDVTPLQIAVMIGAIANGGTLLQPRLVQRVESPRGAAEEIGTREFPPEIRGRLSFDPEHLALIRQVMRADVGNIHPGPNRGTGYKAEVPGMNICAKTGTAENKRPGESRVDKKDVWFASFAPLEDPKYVVIVMVENGVFGGETAAPVAKKIYQAIQKREQSGDFPTSRQFANR
ncbi:MAG TPA: hypothetical protein DCY13_23630 [Verrucomicrobiales bacterium]|nr:hypothetical protein [Verrucomicrobiales bacterium]